MRVTVTRRARRLAVLAGIVLALLALYALSFTPATRDAEAFTAADTVIGSGDIAHPDGKDTATAQIVRGVLAGRAGALAYTLGDNVYPEGTAPHLDSKYDPDWGDFKSRTLPMLGNHDDVIDTGSVQPSKDYFATAAHDLSPTYYSVQLTPDWQFIALDSNKLEDNTTTSAPGCAVGTTQHNFLVNQLQQAKAAGKNTIVGWHHARFSISNDNPSDSDGCPPAFWETAVEEDADVVLNSHTHMYERYGHTSKLGGNCATRECPVYFVVGTGGAPLDTVGGSEPGLDQHEIQYGVLQLNLAAGSFDYRFKTVNNGTVDSGTYQVNP